MAERTDVAPDPRLFRGVVDDGRPQVLQAMPAAQVKERSASFDIVRIAETRMARFHAWLDTRARRTPP